jgi:hypothetical protein
MIQTYILLQDESPVDAVKSGADKAICGDCAFRPLLAKAAGTEQAACYVNKGHGPLAVWRAWTIGRYPKIDPTGAGTLAGDIGRPIRVGTYGDPAMVPVHVWRTLLAGSGGKHTGYTHQWKRAPFLRELAMASVDSLEDLEEARRARWRTFRVDDGTGIQPGEIVCPASIEAGKRTTCAQCSLCDGARDDDRRKSILIQPHGGAIALELARAGRQ